MEENIALTGTMSYRLYTDGSTTYDIEILYGGSSRNSNVSNPYLLSTTSLLDVAVQVETTGITINSQNNPINLGDNANITFTFHKSSDILETYDVEDVEVSSGYDSDYWTEGVDYDWWDAGGGLTALNLSTGAGTRLNTTGIKTVYLHAINQSVEEAIDKAFVIINDINSIVRKTLNDSSQAQIQVYRGEEVNLEIDFIDGRNGLDITDATVNYTLDGIENTIPYDIGNQNYSVLINTTLLDFQTYTVTIEANKTNYETQVTSIVIVVLQKPTLLSLNSPGITQYGNDVSIIATYEDAITGDPIDIGTSYVDALVDGYPGIVPTIGELSPGVFNITFDTWDFSSLGDFNITITCDWVLGMPYYVNQSRQTTLELQNRLTQLYTTNTFGEKIWGTNFTVNAFFIDLGDGSSIDNSTGFLDIAVSCPTRPQVNSNTVGITYNTTEDTWKLEFDPESFQNPGATYTVNVDFNWSATGAPYYINQSVSFNVRITAAPTQLTLLPGAQTQIAGNYHELTFFFSNEATGSGINLTEDGETLQQNVNVSTTHADFNSSIYNPSSNLTTNGTDGYFFVAINITAWSESNIHAFNISLDVDNYNTIINYSFTLILVPKYTILETEAITSGHLGQDINITLFYHLQSTQTAIEPDSVLVSTNETSDYWNTFDFDWTYNSGSERIVVTIHTGLSGVRINSEGTHSFFINVSASTYESQRVRSIISINTIPTNITTVLVDSVNVTGPLPTSSAYIGDLVDVAVYFKNLFNDSAVDDGTMTITLGAWSDSVTWDGTSEYYNVTLNTNDFGVGPATFTIVATKGNYTQASVQLKLDILSVSTDLVHFLEGVNNNSISVYYGQNITISALYNDTNSNVNITSPSTALSLTGGATIIDGANWTNIGDFWVAEVNTTDIGGPGTYSMTLSAGLTDYQTGITTFLISIRQIPTELLAYNFSGELQDTYTAYWGEEVNVSVAYNNTITGSLIMGATVEPGSGYSYDLTLDGSWYNFSFNTSTFGQPNVYVITISGSLQNHTSSTTYVTITVLAIPTILEVYQGGVVNTSVNEFYGENLTLDLVLYDTLNAENVSGVTFSYANGSMIPVSGGPELYSMERNTSGLGDIGIYQFTITARKTNYATDSEVITVNILPIPTSISLYINGTDRTSSLQETIDFQSSVNLTVYFNDTFGDPVSNANLSFTFDNGTVNFFQMNEIGATGNYSIILDSDELGSGPQYVFMFSAVKSNHETVFARINIFLNAIPTALNITYNSTMIDRSGSGNTISAVYTDTVSLAVDYISYLQGNLQLDDTAPGVKIAAYINEQELLATWSAANGSWILDIDTSIGAYALSAGLTHQVLVIGEATGYQSDSFSFLLDIELLPTNLTVNINNTYYADFLDSQVYLKDQLLINVSYERIYGATVPLAGVGDVWVELYFLNDTNGMPVTYEIFPNLITGNFSTFFTLDLNTFESGVKDFYISATLSNHESKELKFSLILDNVNTTMAVLVNGKNQTTIGDETIRIGNTINFSVNYAETSTLANLSGATVRVRYVNDFNGTISTQLLSFNGTSYLGTLTLDTSRFISQLKILTFTASLPNYETRTRTFTVNVEKIKVDTLFSTTSNETATTSLLVDRGEILTFRINLLQAGVENFTDLDSITVTATADFLGSEVVTLTPEFNSTGNYTGFFVSRGIQSPKNPRDSGYDIVIKVEVSDPVLLQQYEFDTFTQVKLYVREDEGPPAWLFYVILAALVAVSVYFILYQIRFKYPPIVRKIQDLRRVVSRGKPAIKIKAPKVKSREENIYTHFSKQINSYSFLQTRDSRHAVKSSGYAPTSDTSIEMEFGVPAIEPEEKQVSPKTLKAKKVKKETISKPAVKTESKAEAKPPSAPAKPETGLPVPQPVGKVPKPKLVVKRPPLPKPSPEGLPKPSVKPIKEIKAPGAKPTTPESMYQKLVLLEQKRYKAERSLRDLNAKYNKGIITDDEFANYKEKLTVTLEKIKNQISDIRRRLISV
ncbi:hypothetical protein GF325_16525 [Candidatus Bathyarchaeota archaeon]|nr:hypothetical protein [Candidatus Bathyarchaeota archaeon]